LWRRTLTFLHKRKPPIWQLSSALRRPRKPCRLALFGNTPKQTPAASSLLAMVATWVRPHRLALRSSMSALSSRSNHDNLDIAYAPPCKLKTRSSGKSRAFLLLAVHMWRDVPRRWQLAPTLADTPPPGASDPCPSPCSSSQDQECVQPPPEYNPPPTPAHATPNLHVVPCHARHYLLPPVLI
jgi:hypothetical protein